MDVFKLSRFGSVLAGLFLGSSFYFVSPSYSASALAAWLIRSDGVLELRTKTGTRLKAFFQSAGAGKGDRVWVDFPGELSKPRRISGNGPIKEVRLGKPFSGFTRLVIEFSPSIEIDPRKLKLIGISPNRWELSFDDLSLYSYELKKIGEGDVKRSFRKPSFLGYGRPTYLLDASTLPSVTRGRYKVVIDPGHGGPDPGAVGINGLRETDVVLDVSLQVTEFLKEKGVTVLLTRKKEIDLDLPPRVARANKSKASAFVSIHANASRDHRRDVNGVETYYYTGYRGLSLAKKIHKEIVRVSPGSPDRGVRRSRFFVIRRTDMPAALVEVGFVTGRIDARKLRQSEHRQRLAFAIAKGILNYLKGAR
ncbi:N-acetylmuramoyl-L-alanine amidase [Prochlorococcus sp. MIT 1223]|uniref:N-acetylmuramoyl-L-alanine amidase n=1 Tax=Prochlorococcus sp. MIT 1223 TaxID=3096217 RepID=UPI002A757554|nr:N-acetylmuramoyl-L-alanine amidase [Prochlorococcus sp. MIT 1223]